MSSTSRRSFIRSLFAATAAAPALAERGLAHALATVDAAGPRSPAALAADEDFWLEIQRAFTVDRTLINLHNGGVSPSPRVVQDAMRRYLEFSNEAPVHTMWRILEPQIESVRRDLAAAFGCDPEEMAITRNASEALEIVQLGLPLERGDEVVTTNQDYPRMLTTWRQRVRRDGIVLKEISFPVPPPSLDDLAERIERAVTPRTRIIHICHITNLTGQIFPVRRICRWARERGIEVIVDGAHAFAQFPFTRDELDCDYYGTSLHKWLLAPHGTGFLYVRREKIPGIWPLMAAAEKQDADIRKFEEIGTHPAANHNAIAEALTFHQGIGADRKAARLRFLFHRWAKRLETVPGVRVLTSYDPAQSCGLALVSLPRVGTEQEVGRVVSHLWEAHHIIVTGITHPEFAGLRITPNVYTTLAEVDRFTEVLEGVARRGVPA
jgi:selenocysteine lyase/cysteine desulfurase